MNLYSYILIPIKQLHQQSGKYRIKVNYLLFNYQSFIENMQTTLTFINNLHYIDKISNTSKLSAIWAVQMGNCFEWPIEKMYQWLIQINDILLLLHYVVLFIFAKIIKTKIQESVKSDFRLWKNSKGDRTTEWKAEIIKKLYSFIHCFNYISFAMFV